MFNKKRSNLEDSFDKDFETAKRSFKNAFIGAGIGFIAGAVGGVYLGEAINGYFESLKQAPAVMRYAIDIGSAIACGSAASSVLAAITQIPYFYKTFKKF